MIFREPFISSAADCGTARLRATPQTAHTKTCGARQTLSSFLSHFKKQRTTPARGRPLINETAIVTDGRKIHVWGEICFFFILYVLLCEARASSIPMKIIFRLQNYIILKIFEVINSAVERFPCGSVSGSCLQISVSLKIRTLKCFVMFRV